MRKRNYDEAVQCFKKKLAIKALIAEKTIFVHHGLAPAYKMKGVIDKTISTFKGTIKMIPD